MLKKIEEVIGTETHIPTQQAATLATLASQQQRGSLRGLSLPTSLLLLLLLSATWLDALWRALSFELRVCECECVYVCVCVL